MIFIASIRVEIRLILDNYKRVIEYQFVWKLVLKHLWLAFSVETNFIQKHIQSYQTVTTIITSPINSKFTRIFWLFSSQTDSRWIVHTTKEEKNTLTVMVKGERTY